MNIRTYSDFDAFAASHAADVARVAALSPRATVFQTYEWCVAWWRHRGGHGRRFLALEFVSGTVPVGYALLWRDPFSPVLRPLGDGDSDYHDILAHPDHEPDVVRALLEWLATDGKRFRLSFKQAAPNSVLRSHLLAAQEAVPAAQTALIPGEACPVAALPGTWDAYLRGLGKKRRANVSYYERNLSKHFASVAFAVSTPETVDADREAYFALHQRRWNARWLPGSFADAGTRRFHADAARSLLAGGFLRLHTLVLNRRVEATLYCFHKGATTFYYGGGFEPELARFSVGSVLTARAIRYAIETDGATRFDFLRGNEAYKYAWGAVDAFNAHVLIARRGLAVPLASVSARATLALELGLKNAMHARFGGAGAAKKGTKNG